MTRTHPATALAAVLALGVGGAALGPAQEARAQQGQAQQQQQVERLLGEADQAMQRGDTQGARQAMQQARRIMEGDASSDLAGDPMEFLRLAQRAIDQGALRTAWIALGRAETRLLTRATTAPPGEQAAQGGAIGAIRSARQALTERDIELANERTERALVLARSGNVVGSNVSGAALTGAGTPGAGQPLTGGGSVSTGAGGDAARR